MPGGSAGDGDVGHLGRHPHEREIDEIPIVRLAQMAREYQPAAFATVFVVEFVRIMQREHAVNEGLYGCALAQLSSFI
jgi:hypothetical protein